MSFRDSLQTVIAMGVVISMVLGAMSYFATAKELQMTQLRLEEKILNDRVYDIKKQIWQLQEKNRKYGSECMNWPDERDRKEYNLLLHELEQAQISRGKGVLK